MNWGDLFNTLEEFIPLFAGLTGHPELGVLAQKLINIGEEELQRRMRQTGMTRAEILQDAAATYAQLKAENDALKRAGHENDAQ
jgi:hypothetical protein